MCVSMQVVSTYVKKKEKKEKRKRRVLILQSGLSFTLGMFGSSTLEQCLQSLKTISSITWFFSATANGGY